jgi:hypothetical protein
MLNKWKEAVAECVNEYADRNQWKSIKTFYFWYTYIAFLQFQMYPDSSSDKFVYLAEKKNLITKEIAQYIKEFPGYRQLTEKLEKIDFSGENIILLYQQYISQDFFLDSEGKFFFAEGKNSRDTLGAYYTEEKFAYLITEKAIDDYILSKLKIKNFSRTGEQKDRVLKLFKTLRFADSSCGAGEFLAAVIKYASKVFGLEEELVDALEKNLYGYDVDPVAVLLTKARIMDLLGKKKSSCPVELGNSLLYVEEETDLLEKYQIAAEGRFYAKGMGICSNKEKFDIILGNPPWEKIRFEERKFLFHYVWDKRLLQTKWRREELLAEEVSEENQKFYRNLQQDYICFKKEIKANQKYELSGCGELNTYALFTEWAIRAGREHAWISLIVKASLLKVSVYRALFRYLMTKKILAKAYMFTNRKKIFQIDSREEFAVICLDLSGERNLKISLGIDDYENFADCPQLELSLKTLEKINPLTHMLPNAKSFDEMFFLDRIYRNNKTFGEEYPECVYGRLVHLTSHSKYIRKNRPEGYLPVYEGKYIEQYNGKYATYEGVNTEQKYAEKSQARRIEDVEGGEYPQERYFIEKSFWENLSKNYTQEYSLVWRSLTSATNRRTMIATVLPKMPTCQSIQLLQASGIKELLQILALFNSVIFDFIVRLKMSGLDLTQIIVKQIAVPSRDEYEREIEFMGAASSIEKHINSRIKYLYRNEIRLQKFFEQIDTYEISGGGGRKKVISEIDLLIADAYKIDRAQLKKIVMAFNKYYSKEEAETWF